MGGAEEADPEIPDLKKHATWKAETRPYLKLRELALQLWEALRQLDYGGVNDSANNKVAVWSVTVMAPGREQEHFDYFFDQASKKGPSKKGAAKKDGQTGIYFMGELLDKDKFDGKVSLFRHHYPATNHKERGTWPSWLRRNCCSVLSHRPSSILGASPFGHKNIVRNNQLW